MKKSEMCGLRIFVAGTCVVLGLQLGIVQASNAESAESAESTAVPAAVSTPQATIEAFHAELLEIMKHAKELGIQGRIDKLGPLMNRAFDLTFMVSKTVGRHWRKLSTEDKDLWVDAFKRFTTANYAGRFTGFTGEEFVTNGVEEAPRGTRVVLTKIVIPDDDDVQLNYRLIERDGAWRVIDVFLDGTVSELALRRSEYSSALKREGFASLLESVEAKIIDLKAEDLAEG